MKAKRKYPALVALTALCLWLLWASSLVQFTISSKGMEPSFYEGDRVMVSRLSYGWRPRIPFNFGNPCFGYERPEKGDWMAFRNPSEGSLEKKNQGVLIGKCLAIPGDTVWISWDGTILDNTHHTSQAYPFVVPGKGLKIDVTRWNAALLCRTLNYHEHRYATNQGDTLIIMEGKKKRSVCFTKDYFWFGQTNTQSKCDTRYLGFLPENNLIGRAVFVSYSVNPEAPAYACLRASRFFHKISKN